MTRFVGKKTSAVRWLAVAVHGGICALARSGSAHAENYAVLVRQIDGKDSVPAHMICMENKICRGTMLISTPGGHRRVFISAMIGAGNAYVGLRTGQRDLSCSRGQDFMLLALAPASAAAQAMPWSAMMPHRCAAMLFRIRPKSRSRRRNCLRFYASICARPTAATERYATAALSSRRLCSAVLPLVSTSTSALL
jgi:hypothetical protein